MIACGRPEFRQIERDIGPPIRTSSGAIRMMVILESSMRDARRLRGAGRSARCLDCSAASTCTRAEHHPHPRQRRADHQLRHQAARQDAAASSSRGKQGEKEAIEQLIDERLMLQEAKRRNVDVTDAEVDAGVRQARARRQADRRRNSRRRCARPGIDPQTFKELPARQHGVAADRARALPRDRRGHRPGRRRGAHQRATDADGGRADGYRIHAAADHLRRAGRRRRRRGGAAAQARRTPSAAPFRAATAACSRSAGTPGIVVKPQVRREEGQLTPAHEGSARHARGRRHHRAGARRGRHPAPRGLRQERDRRARPRRRSRRARSSPTSAAQLLARRYLRDLRSDAVIEYR